MLVHQMLVTDALKEAGGVGPFVDGIGAPALLDEVGRKETLFGVIPSVFTGFGQRCFWLGARADFVAGPDPAIDQGELYFQAFGKFHDHPGTALGRSEIQLHDLAFPWPDPLQAVDMSIHAST